MSSPQARFKTSRPSKQIVKAEIDSANSQSLSRRQALLLGAGTLAAANFATTDTVQAETEAVTASGITSAETVQLGQSGRVIANLYSFVTFVKLLLLILLNAVQACRSAQLAWEHGVGVIALDIGAMAMSTRKMTTWKLTRQWLAMASAL